MKKYGRGPSPDLFVDLKSSVSGFAVLLAGVVGFRCGRNRLRAFLVAGTQWASFEANPQSARLVFKASLCLSGKATKTNFTVEPHALRRLLGKLEPICNLGGVGYEVLLLVWRSKCYHFN
ncbi:hypothetical protein [Lapidilactobacillus luobeiensis]|uniref:hypothetical protein n=1 Tax=Lapidilactobacillus luobeiensis TaxID=2950371 RepID=UPI0021C415E2|nr:hypothetical protein [Lapidilactobacillus luobeiensis]